MTGNSHNNHHSGEKAGIVGIIVNFTLFLSKLITGLITGAVSITADSINNLSDMGSSIISLVSFKIAKKPADREHPYGHARIEYVMSMIIAFIIFSTGISLLRDAAVKIFNPAETVFNIVLVPVLLFSIIAKAFLGIYYLRLGKKLDSAVLRAGATDSFTDVVSTSVILIVMLVYKFTGFDADAYMGLCVSVLVIISAVKIISESMNSILGTAPDEALIESIKNIAGSTPDIFEVHDILVHNYGGGKTIASLHVAVDGSRSAFEIHSIIDALEHRILDELSVECTIHTDPVDIHDKTLKKVTEKVSGLIHGIDERLTIHDCRIVEQDGSKVLEFDVLQPFELTEDISQLIEEKISTVYPQYKLHITIDKG